MRSFTKRVPRAGVLTVGLVVAALTFLAVWSFTNTAPSTPAPDKSRAAQQPSGGAQRPSGGAGQSGARATQGPGAAPDAERSPAGIKPLDVYLGWLKPTDTAVLVVRGPEPDKRVVIGIARPFQTEEEDAGHLYDIPGLSELIPSAELTGFRAALQKTPQNPPKYKIEERGQASVADIPYDQIDQQFIKYLHDAQPSLSDLEIWNMTVAGYAAPIRVALVGDLTLAQPSTTFSPHGKAEGVLVELLAALAMKENKDIRSLTVRDDCEGTRDRITAVQRSPLSLDLRQALRKSRAGKVSGGRSQETENEYIINNTGWITNPMRVEISPPSRLRNIRVTSTLPTRQEILDAATVLELPACTSARLTFAPLQIYESFSAPVHFAQGEAALRAEIPELDLRWGWIIGGLLVFLFLVYLLWKLITYAPASVPDNDRGFSDVMNKKPARRWWERLMFWRRRASPRTEAAGLSIAPPPPDAPFSAGSLEGAVRGALTSNEAAQVALAAQRKSLDDIARLLAKIQEHDELQAKARRLTEELQTWKDTLREIADGPDPKPDEIVTRWRAAATAWQDVEGKVKNLKKLLAGDAPIPEDQKFNIDDTLTESYEAAQTLKSLSDEYQLAAPRIAGAIRPGESGNGNAVRHRPNELATEVTGLRALFDQVVTELAELLQVGGESRSYSSESVAGVRMHFGGLQKFRGTRERLESDYRVRCARALAAGIGEVGVALLKIHRHDDRHAWLLAGTNMEPKLLGEQLGDMVKSADNVLGAELSRSAQSLDGKAPAPEDVNKVLISFVKHLVDGQHGIALTDVLRLRQSMEAYCRGEAHPDAARLYSDGEGFRRACEQVFFLFACLGVRFHDVRFLEDPTKGGWKFGEAEAAPPIERSENLIGAVRGQAAYEKTVEDVSAWGFECDLDHSLSRQTQLWMWRTSSHEASET